MYNRDYNYQGTSDEITIHQLNKKILVNEVVDEDLPMIKYFFDKLTMKERWKTYFTLYFEKYAVDARAN